MNRAFRSLDAAWCAYLTAIPVYKRHRRGSSSGTILICPAPRPCIPPLAFPLHARKIRAPFVRSLARSLISLAYPLVRFAISLYADVYMSSTYTRAGRYRNVIKYRCIDGRRCCAAFNHLYFAWFPFAIVSQWQSAHSNPVSLRRYYSRGDFDSAARKQRACVRACVRSRLVTKRLKCTVEYFIGRVRRAS